MAYYNYILPSHPHTSHSGYISIWRSQCPTLRINSSILWWLRRMAESRRQKYSCNSLQGREGGSPCVGISNTHSILSIMHAHNVVFSSGIACPFLFCFSAHLEKQKLSCNVIVLITVLPALYIVNMHLQYMIYNLGCILHVCVLVIVHTLLSCRDGQE